MTDISRRSMLAGLLGLVAAVPAFAGDTEPDGRYRLRWRRWRLRLRRPARRRVRLLRPDPLPDPPPRKRQRAVSEPQYYYRDVGPEPEEDFELPQDCQEVRKSIRALDPERLAQTMAKMTKKQLETVERCTR